MASIPAARRFAPRHRRDNLIFLAMVLLVWLGILMGFVPQVIRHVQLHRPPYPLIVHIHGPVFAAWLVLLTVQLGLVRTGNVRLHRKLGMIGMALAAVMVVLGPATAIVVDRAHIGTPQDDPGFLAIQLEDMIGFAGLVAAAFWFRQRPDAHKRLIVLATLHISDAGFSRWLGGYFVAVLGPSSTASLILQLYFANDLLVVGLGVYDWATRGRLHPVYLPAVAWIVLVQGVSLWFYMNPWWQATQAHLLGG
jgi:hypothetical protein